MRMMMAYAAVILISAGLVGCGGGAATMAPSVANAELGATTGDAIPVEATVAAVEDVDLPAPWTTEVMDARDAPETLLAAWSGAPNRDWCAPMAPRSARGAQATQTTFDGGWAVEFGGQNGESFGVAGTAMMVDDEAPASEVERRAYVDGSEAQIESSEDAHVASLAIQGQGCVYQVWSFAGREHLQSLLDDLRFVQAP